MEEKIRFTLHPGFVSHVVGIVGVYRQVCQQPRLPELIVICLSQWIRPRSAEWRPGSSGLGNAAINDRNDGTGVLAG